MDHYVEYLEHRLADLGEELHVLTELVRKDPEVSRVHYDRDDGVTVELEHWAVRHLAVSALESFRQGGGTNYVTFTLASPDGWCEVTVRPCWGRRTPQQDLAELRAEVQRLRARLDELEPRPERSEESTP